MPQTDAARADPTQADARAARLELERLLSDRDLGLPAGFVDAVERYVALLLDANRRLNLTRVVEPEPVARLHLLDALSALPLLDELPRSDQCLDLGSGGGVPGLVLALARPDRRWVLVDSLRKKADVLRGFAAALGIGNVEVVAERAEILGRDPAHRERHDVVAARACAALPVLAEYALPLLAVGGTLVACAALPVLAEYALPLLAVGGTLVAWKGPIADDELESGRAAAAACGGRHPSVHSSGFAALGDHRFVMIEKDRPTPERYPRRAGEPARRPLE